MTPAAVPIEHALLLAEILFAVGVVGLLTRRNIFFMLIAIEVMLNAAGLAFIAAGALHAEQDGQIMFLFILTMAAAEVSVGLAIVIQLYHRLRTLDTDAARLLGLD